MRRVADAIVKDEELSPYADKARAQELLLIGTSMGSARPKVVVEDDGLWIVKFNRVNDKGNYTRIEHAMLVLARSCGLTTAESKVAAIGVSAMRERVKFSWCEVARGQGVTEKDCERISGAFAYPGFDLTCE